MIASEADRLERLVGDVLDLAKLQAHRFTVRQEEVDLGRVLDHAYGAFTEEARRRDIDYRLETDAEPPVIVSDGDRVLQVISNLLSNAFRWTPDGGQVELGLGAANGVVRVDVSDSGPGIKVDDRARIFEPFISSDVNGTGLGLPIANELALALGGRIELESDPGSGEPLPARPTGPSRRLVALQAAAACPTSASTSCDARPSPLKEDSSASCVRSALEAGEPRVDSTPARAHEIDQKREVVHARMPLRE